MTRTKRPARILALALCLALALALLGGTAALAEKKEGTVWFHFMREPFYASDTLPSWLTPMAKMDQMDLFELDSDGYPDFNTQSFVDTLSVEWLSGDFSQEMIDACFRVVSRQYLLIDSKVLTTPGKARCRIMAENEQYRCDREFDLTVIDYKDDPITWYDRKVTADARVGDTLDTYSLLSTQGIDGLEYSVFPYYSGDIETQYQSATVNKEGTYSLPIRVEVRGCSFCIPATINVSAAGKEPAADTGTEEAVTVRNFKELQKAVSETRSNRILISAKYKHGKLPDDYELKIGEGRTVVFAPEEGQENAVIDGSLDLSGKGTVVFDRVNIVGTEGCCALEATDGITVTACDVRGADSKKLSGDTAVYAREATVKAGNVVGGNSAAHLGGDGVFARDAVVEVASAAGGNSDQGVGGAGAVSVRGARVTVTGEAAGGSGGTAGGKGLLISTTGSAAAQAAREGEKTESKKTWDPEVIATVSQLENALRNGKTEITLDKKFTWEVTGNASLFLPSDDTIRISGPEGGKNLVIKNGGFNFYEGSWEFDRIDITCSKKSAVLYACDDARVVWNGSVKTTAGNALYTVGDAQVRVNGNLDGTSKDYTTVAVIDHSHAEINGNVSSNTNNAIVVKENGSLIMNGNVKTGASKNYPSVYVYSGSLVFTGSITSGGVAVRTNNASVRIEGEITGKTKDYYIVHVMGGDVVINGTITAPYPYKASSYGHLLLNGKDSYEKKRDEGADIIY